MDFVVIQKKGIVFNVDKSWLLAWSLSQKEKGGRGPPDMPVSTCVCWGPCRHHLIIWCFYQIARFCYFSVVSVRFCNDQMFLTQGFVFRLFHCLIWESSCRHVDFKIVSISYGQHFLKNKSRKKNPIPLLTSPFGPRRNVFQQNKFK